MMSDSSLDPADVASMALFQDLAALDGMDDDDERRPAMLASALRTVEELTAMGGGSVGLVRLQALREALGEEVES